MPIVNEWPTWFPESQTVKDLRKAKSDYLKSEERFEEALNGDATILRIKKITKNLRGQTSGQNRRRTDEQ